MSNKIRFWLICSCLRLAMLVAKTGCGSSEWIRDAAGRTGFREFTYPHRSW